MWIPKWYMVKPTASSTAASDIGGTSASGGFDAWFSGSATP